jgi:hypothetical protein
MKKLFTILALSPLLVFAQTAKFEPTLQKRTTSDVSFPNPNTNKVSNKTTAANGIYPSTQVGYTNYDLQSNAAVSRRIIQHSGNKISLVWTTAKTGSSANFSDRGAGYNHFDGTNWTSNNDDASARRENIRSGWPSIGVVQSGAKSLEYILSHAVTASGQAGGFYFGKNGQVGDNVFTGSVVLNDTYKNSEPGPIWGRSAVSNNKIFLISCFTSPNAGAGQPDTPIINGIKMPNVYSIYDAASDTWVIKNQLLPFYDSTRYTFGNADAYAIDATSSKVAIVIGGLQDDLALWQTTDGGQNWTKTIIDTFLMPGVLRDRTKSYPGNNGAVEVLIDNNGKTHVFYPWLGSFYDTIVGVDTSRYVSYGNNVNGIIHWSEYTDGNNSYLPAVIAGGMLDVNADQTLTVGANTRARDWGGYGNALSFSQGGATVTYAALTTMPSASIDASGNMFLTYTSVIEDDLSADDENYSDIYVVYSSDSGKTWSAPQNITQTIGVEEVFPCQARVADNNIRLMYLEKNDPGIFVGQTSGNNPEQPQIPVKYLEVPVSKIIAGNAGVNSVNNYTFGVSQNYPNPFNNETNFTLNLKKAGNVSMKITNVIGQEVYFKNLGNMSAGSQTLNFNSKLSSGVYFYSFIVDGQMITRRMIVE